MKNRSLVVLFFLTWITMLSGCAAIEGIFKAGMGFGIFIVIFIIGLVIYLITRIGGKK